MWWAIHVPGGGWSASELVRPGARDIALTREPAEVLAAHEEDR